MKSFLLGHTYGLKYRCGKEINERPGARVRMPNPSQKRVFLLLVALAELSRQQTMQFSTTGEQRECSFVEPLSVRQSATTSRRRRIVGFREGVCRVQWRENGPTRHELCQQSQWFENDLSGMSGFPTRRERWGKLRVISMETRSRRKPTGQGPRTIEDSPRRASTTRFWTPVGLHRRGWGRSRVCNCIRILVGPARFELATSCTPSNKYQSLTDHPH